MDSSKKPFEITGRHVLFALIGFFGIIIVANAIMVRLAVQSFPGEQEEKSYYQGLNYNDALEKKERQAATGWRASLIEIPATDGADYIDVKLLERNGEPVRQARLSGQLSRPTTAVGQRSLDFMAQGDGVYRARVEGLARGAWDLSLTARSGQDDSPAALEATTRITVE